MEPVLADKEVLLTALNIKAMSFDGSDEGQDEDKDGDKMARNNSILGDLVEAGMAGEGGGMAGGVPIIVDLAFASNVRVLDDHELHLDNVELYKVKCYTQSDISLSFVVVCGAFKAFILSGNAVDLIPAFGRV